MQMTLATRWDEKRGGSPIVREIEKLGSTFRIRQFHRSISVFVANLAKAL
jgi:hypothetical protein